MIRNVAGFPGLTSIVQGSLLLLCHTQTWPPVVSLSSPLGSQNPLLMGKCLVGGCLCGTFHRTGLGKPSSKCLILAGNWLDCPSVHCHPLCPPADNSGFQAQPSANRMKNVQSCSFLRLPPQYAFWQHKSLFSAQDVIYCLKSLAWSTPLTFLVHGPAAQGVEIP